jgi:hypothetical protein
MDINDLEEIVLVRPAHPSTYFSSN